MTTIAPAKTSLIYDYLVEKVKEKLTHKVQLFNPYDIGTNNELFLRDGFGVGFMGGAQQPMQGCCIRLSRDIKITLTKKFYATENDADNRALAEKELLEEAVILMKHFEGDSQLGGLAAKFTFQNDSGIQQIYTNSQYYIFLEMNFDAEFIDEIE